MKRLAIAVVLVAMLIVALGALSTTAALAAPAQKSPWVNTEVTCFSQVDTPGQWYSNLKPPGGIAQCFTH